MTQEASSRPEPILILGMERSGTSLVAEMVHRWGAFGGAPSDLENGDQHNPHGYFEEPQLQQLLNRLVKGRFWRPELLSTIGQQADEPEVRSAALRLIHEMRLRSEIWFWKEPFISVTLPFLQRLLPDPVYIIPVRNPYESALSWQLYFLPFELQGSVRVVQAGLLRWYCMIRATLHGTEASRRKIFLSYESLIQNPAQQCGRLCRFLDEQFGLGEGAEERVARMLEAVDPDLYRNRSSVPFCDMPQPRPEQKALYRILQRKIEEPSVPFDLAEFPFPQLYVEYLDNLEVFQQIYQQLLPGTGRSARR